MCIMKPRFLRRSLQSSSHHREGHTTHLGCGWPVYHRIHVLYPESYDAYQLFIQRTIRQRSSRSFISWLPGVWSMIPKYLESLLFYERNSIWYRSCFRALILCLYSLTFVQISKMTVPSLSSHQVGKMTEGGFRMNLSRLETFYPVIPTCYALHPSWAFLLRIYLIRGPCPFKGASVQKYRP